MYAAHKHGTRRKKTTAQTDRHRRTVDRVRTFDIPVRNFRAQRVLSFCFQSYFLFILFGYQFATYSTGTYSYRAGLGLAFTEFNTLQIVACQRYIQYSSYSIHVTIAITTTCCNSSAEIRYSLNCDITGKPSVSGSNTIIFFFINVHKKALCCQWRRFVDEGTGKKRRGLCVRVLWLAIPKATVIRQW